MLFEGQPEAEVLLTSRHFKLGWSACRVREWLAPTQCFSSRGYGHKAKLEMDTCYSCGTRRHLDRECTADAKCLVCNQNEHRANSMACPKYRECVEKLRNRRKISGSKKALASASKTEEEPKTRQEKTPNQRKMRTKT
ncbi:hypothetical protein BIW11_00404 [Tropilaelaps mercedesae]|uniref:CCHC-type domain-containing protein n=1 Tax=Tropilaelaps mercedesae TaxID=418985 RepID=A0A1V9XW66_9ACAR|nr:hypothetical protein BIW11_00404 [Tropilaelaps mercedesae]